jgi:hypothetical protein
VEESGSRIGSAVMHRVAELMGFWLEQGLFWLALAAFLDFIGLGKIW